MTKLAPFFKRFTEDQIKQGYKNSLDGLIRMQTRAKLTGKKVNGYTLNQLNEYVNRYEELINNN